MKNKNKIIFSFAVALFFVLPLVTSAKSDWQKLLEKYDIPDNFWSSFLPDVNQGDYCKAISSYLKTYPNKNDDVDNSPCDDNGEAIAAQGKYPLPATSGKIALEQHLWLTNSQSASNHYSMTNTSKSCRNGMAGGYGAFGPLKKSDKQEEKYYIAMRWGYADWTEPASSLSGGLGKGDISLTLKNAKEFPKSGYIKIGSEYIHYSSKSSNKLKGLQRGYKSPASSHGTGNSVKLVYRYQGGQWEQVTRALNINKKEQDWYKEKEVLVTNKRNGKQVVASILESGPAIWTDRVGGLSPEAFQAIGARNDEKCTFQYVSDKTKLGPAK